MYKSRITKAISLPSLLEMLCLCVLCVCVCQLMSLSVKFTSTFSNPSCLMCHLSMNQTCYGTALHARIDYEWGNFWERMLCHFSLICPFVRCFNMRNFKQDWRKFRSLNFNIISVFFFPNLLPHILNTTDIDANGF